MFSGSIHKHKPADMNQKGFHVVRIAGVMGPIIGFTVSIQHLRDITEPLNKASEFPSPKGYFVIALFDETLV